LEKKIVRQSFYCGIITFAICFLFALSKELSGLLIFSNILPGFFYGWVLSDLSNSEFKLKRILFVLLSGALFIFVAWIATGYSFFGGNTVICFPIGSVLGSTLLLILYYLLIDNKMALARGLVVALLIGLISSVLLFMGDNLEQHVNDYSIKGIINFGFTLLIFPVWQTLFGWTIYKLKKSYSPFVLAPVA